MYVGFPMLPDVTYLMHSGYHKSFQTKIETQYSMHSTLSNMLVTWVIVLMCVCGLLLSRILTDVFASVYCMEQKIFRYYVKL